MFVRFNLHYIDDATCSLLFRACFVALFAQKRRSGFFNDTGRAMTRQRDKLLLTPRRNVSIRIVWVRAGAMLVCSLPLGWRYYHGADSLQPSQRSRTARNLADDDAWRRAGFDDLRHRVRVYRGPEGVSSQFRPGSKLDG